ncbi:hypothetical protein QZH41_006553 [Actinostola sp. cb2023]|nr:hypothetical protein QZH41_006553 [Actinostola sp. cb2023]
MCSDPWSKQSIDMEMFGTKSSYFPKDLFKDYQSLEVKLLEVSHEKDEKHKEAERIKKTWQLKSAKLESQLFHQHKIIEDKEHIITDLKEKLKKSCEECNKCEIEARVNYARAVYAEDEVTKLNILLSKREQTIDELRNKLMTVQSELTIYVTSEARLKGEKEMLQTESSSAFSAAEKFQADLKMATRENDQLSANLSECQQNLRRTEDRFEKLQRNYENLRQSESKLKSKHNEVELENTRMRNEIIQLKKDLELALNRPAEKSYEVISVDNQQNVEAGPESGDLFAIDSEELERANHRIKELEDLLHYHEVENSDVQVKLGHSKGQITKLECELENALRYKSIGAAELEGEKGKLSRLHNEIKNLTSQLEVSEKGAEQLKKEVAKRDRLIDDLRSKIANYDKTIADRDEEVFNLNGKYEYLYLEKEILQEDNRDLLKKLADVEADVKISQDDHDNVSSEARGLHNRISELESKLTESEKDRRFLDEQNISLQQKVDKLEDDLQKINQEKNIFEGQTADLSTLSNRHRDNAVVSKKEVMELRGEVDGMRKQMASKDDTIGRLRDKVNDLNEDLDETKKDLEDSNSRFKGVEGDIKRLEHDVEVKNADIDRLNGILDRTTKERNDAEIQLAGLLEKFKSLNTGTGRSMSLGRPSLEINISKIQDLEGQLSSLRQKVYSLEKENDTQKQTVNFLKNELIDKEDRIGYLQRELDSRGIHDDEAEKMLADYKRKCMVLEKELDELLATKENMEEELSTLRPAVGKLEARVEALTLKKDTLSSQLQEANDRLRLAKEDLHKAEMELMEERKANTSLGKLAKKHELTIEDLTARLRGCEAELERVSRSLSESTFANDSLRAKNQEQERTIADLKARQVDLERELGDLRDHREVIEGDLGSMSYKLSNLNTKVSSIEKDKTYYQGDSEASQAKLRRLKNELIQANNQTREKERLIDELTSKVKDVESNYTTCKRKNKNLEDEINSVRKELEAEKHTNDINRDKINELMAQLEAASMNIPTPVNVSFTESAPMMFQEPLQSEPDGRLDELESLYQSSKDREGSLRHEVEQKNNKVTQLEVEKRKASDRCSEMEHELAMLQRKYHDLEQSLHRAQRERDDFKKDAIEASNKWSFFEQKAENEESERKSLQRQYDDAMHKLRASQEEILKAEENIVEHRLAVQGLTTDKEYREEHLDKLRDSMKFLEDQLHSLNESLSFQREENEKLKDERDNLLENNLTKDNTINRVKADNQVVSTERDRLNEDIKEALDRLENLEQKLDESNRRCEGADEEIEMQNTEIQNLKDELNQGHRRYKQLEEKIQTFEDEADKDQQYIHNLRESKKELEDTIADLRAQLANQSNVVRVIQPAEVQQVQAVVESSPMMDFGDSEEIKRLQDEITGLKKRIKEGEAVIEKNNRLNEFITEGEGKITRLETSLRLCQNKRRARERT